MANRSNKSAVVVANVNLRNITPAELAEKAELARLSRGSANVPAPEEQEGAFDGSEPAQREEFPECVRSSSHVNGKFPFKQILELCEFGGRRLRAPATAEVYMLSAANKLANGRSDILAVYHRDDSGTSCARALLIDVATWIKIWESKEGTSWDAEHLTQKVSWSARKLQIRQERGQPVYETPLGYTVVANFDGVVDIAGKRWNLGKKRFFVSNGMFYSLFMPLNPGSLAQQLCEEIFGKGHVLPQDTAERELLSGMVAKKTNVPMNIILGQSFMNLPAAIIEHEEVYEGFLGKDIPGALRVANYRALRAHIAGIRNGNTTAEDSFGQPEQSEPESAFTDKDFTDPFGA